MKRSQLPTRRLPLRTTTGLSRAKGINRKPTSRRAKSTAQMHAVRRDLEERCEGLCELCGLALVRSERGFIAEHHHRLSRARGGGDGIENALLVHPQCHARTHGRPAISTSEGWILPSRSTPATSPVTYMGRRGALLGTDGSVTFSEEAA